MPFTQYHSAAPHAPATPGFVFAVDPGTPTLVVLCWAVWLTLPAAVAILALFLLDGTDRRGAFWSAAWAKAVSASLAPAGWILTALPAAGPSPAAQAFVAVGRDTTPAALLPMLLVVPLAHVLVCAAAEWAVLRRLFPARPGVLPAVLRANLYGWVVLMLVFGALVMTTGGPDPRDAAQPPSKEVRRTAAVAHDLQD
jgi:hypothetical protein